MYSIFAKTCNYYSNATQRSKCPTYSYNTDNESNLGCGLFLVHSVIHSGNINDMHIL